MNVYEFFQFLKKISSTMKLHLHVQKILRIGKVWEVLNHKLFGTS